MNSSLENKFCDAIEIIVNKVVDQASYDRTVQATVVKCIDQTIGEYKIQYQNSFYYAYSNNSDIVYPDGSAVYIQVPGNDLNKQKTILGTVKKLGINYITTIEEDEAYEVIGKNCISSEGEWKLSSYIRQFGKNVYSRDNNINEIKLNITDVEEYIKNAKSIICGATIQTSLVAEQQLKGNYGISFALDFIDNSKPESIVTRYYTVDVNKMYGNPYRLIQKTRQYGVFDIDGENFLSVKSISIFNYDFPLEGNGSVIEDIFFSNFELSGANRLSNEDINNYSLTFVTPRGKYFDKNGYDTLYINAEVRVKGKVVNLDSQKLPFYWFIEHMGVTAKSEYYNKYGGQGWKCLNKSTEVIPATNTDPAVVEWIPESNKWTVTKNECPARNTKYKCVVVYDGTVISREIEIINRDSLYDVTIESDMGTTFYFDGNRESGYPTLTCKINGKENTSYSYSWAIINNSGNFNSLAETVEANKVHQDWINKYNKIVNSDDYKEIKESQLEIQGINQYFREDKFNMRVEGNKIYHVDISQITNFSTYSCTVYSGNVYIGTASIVLVNKLLPEGSYSLIINDGTHIYKYNENGISPASNALDNPIDIKALTFTIYDSDGNEVSNDAASHSDIKWAVPAENTLLKVPYETDESSNGYNIYRNTTSFSYFIEDRYDIAKQNNNINLFVIYKGISLSASTDLTFVKEGESGTNGTEFACRIVPSLKNETSFSGYPMITQFGSSNNKYFNFTPSNINKPFKVQLWHNEDRIYEGTDSANSNEGKYVQVKWSVLKKKKNGNTQDLTSINISENGIFSFSGYSGEEIVNIIQAEINYDGVVYYATLPLITARVSNLQTKVELKYGSGFRYAIYSSDGRSPKYDNTSPFEINVYNNVNNIWCDVTSSYTYSWNDRGLDLLNKTVYNLEVKNNQKWKKPIDSYDGECLFNAITCDIKDSSGNIYASIHIPVHLYLNRYGLSAINGWDGNSVDISGDGGYILAPQIGAGQKNDDNSFTGVVMGKVKESGQTSADIGLLGYSEGRRSIFLDAETGKAEFGIKNSNQIIIDPSSGKAEIRSGNYSTTKKTGMLIDFSIPQILFGSGNFSVNEKGEIVSKGGGTIAGWNITDTKLYKDKVGISSDNSIDSNYAFWAGANAGKENVQPNNPLFGVRYDGTILAQQGLIGRGSQRITIGHSQADGETPERSALYSGSKSSFTADAAGFYIGTDGIALGRYDKREVLDENGNVLKDENGNTIYGGNSYFEVTSSGQFVARSGYIGNGEKGWQIGDTFLKNGRDGYNTKGNSKSGGIYLGVDGIGLGIKANDFKVTRSGSLTCQKGTIGGWLISSNTLRSKDTGGIVLKTNDHQGEISSSNWYIRGDGTASFSDVTITGGSLNINNRAIINSDGSASFSDVTISGGSLNINGAAKINSDGSAEFSSVTIKGSSSLTIGGTTIDSSQLKMTANNTMVGNMSLQGYVDDLVAKKITADYIKAMFTSSFSIDVKIITVHDYISMSGKSFTPQTITVDGKDYLVLAESGRNT